MSHDARGHTRRVKSFGNDSISVSGTPASPLATAGQALFAPSTARFCGPRQVQLGAKISF